MSGYQHTVAAGDGLLHIRSDPVIGQETVFGYGLLHVKILEARGIRGDEFNGMGKADPFLKVKHGHQDRPVTLPSEPHYDAGSKPVWNTEFTFPISQGGTNDHNILEIEIWNRNRNTRLLRPDNMLGHLRLGRLADWIVRESRNNTELAWYPVFKKHRQRHKDQTVDQVKGEILIKFYFEDISQKVFKDGQHPNATVAKLGSQVSSHDTTTRPSFHREVVGSRLRTLLGGIGTLLIPTLGLAAAVV